MSGSPSWPGLLELSSAPPVDRVGWKFANLGRHADAYPVPLAVAIPTEWFEIAIGDRRPEIVRLVEQLAAVNGATMPTTVVALQKLFGDLEVPAPCRNAVSAWIARHSDGGTRWCVRSSNADEDTAVSSGAGVYRSELDLAGPEEVCQAIVRCWRSSFEIPAVSHRLHADSLTEVRGVSVFLQRMVQPVVAGVAIAEPGRLRALEYVEGLGDSLVSGLLTPASYDGTEPVDHACALDAAAAMTRQLAADRAETIDVEWAHDGERLWLLQVRPVADGTVARSASGVFQAVDLYAPTPPGVALGRLSTLTQAIRTKRIPVFQAAAANGLPTVRGSVLVLNRAGLAAATPSAHLPWLTGESAEVVIDVAPEIRQVIVPQDRLAGILAETLGLTERDDRVHTVLVREFIAGNHGLITVHLGNGIVLAEWSDQGLLAMNRDGAHTGQARLSVRQTTDGELTEAAMSIGVPAAQLVRAVDTTVAFDTADPGAHLEWVTTGGRLVLVDYSRSVQQVGATRSGRVLSQGETTGPVCVLDSVGDVASLNLAPTVNSYGVAPGFAHRALTEMRNRLRAFDSPPVVFVDRPHAALAAVLDDAAGFVFREGGTLCHLAILLRERGMPGIVAESDPPASGWAHIHDGTVVPLARPLEFPV